MRLIILAVFWFAIVRHGQALFFEYRSMDACRIVQQSYKKSLPTAKITECMGKGFEKAPEKQGSLIPKDAA